MKPIRYIAVFLIVFMAVSDSYAQVPDISYESPQSYRVGTPVPPLFPVNNGGTVPPNPFGQINIYAGTGTAGMQNGPKNTATFKAPQDVKLDAAGNLFVADAGNNVIRKIAADGTVSVFAGSGTAGSADGLGTGASFNGPSGLAFDKLGNLFVADRNNHTIRQITPAGLVTTLAGKAGFAGLVNSQGNFARFNLPTSLAVDDLGGLYVCDYGNNVIRHVAPDGNCSTVAGDGKAGFTDGKGVLASINKPNTIVNGHDGLMYFGDDSRIRTIDKDDNVVTIGGGPLSGDWDGTGKAARFNVPAGITRDGGGVLYIADNTFSLLRRMDPVGAINTIAKSPLNSPGGVDIDKDGNLYIANAGENTVRKLVTTGYYIEPALPAGLTFNITTGEISGTPTAKIQASNYGIFAYNTYGRSVFTISIEVRETNLIPQHITFGSLPTGTVGNPDIDPGATSDSPVPITYESSDLSVAIIANGKIHMIGAGPVTITAHQQGSIDYAEATPVSQTMEVLPAPDLAKPDVTAKAGPFVLPLDKFGNYTITADQLATITPGPQTPPLTITIRPSATFTCDDVGDQTVTVGAGYGPDPADPLNAEFDQPSALSYDPFGNIYVSDQAYYKIRKYDVETHVFTLAGGIAGFRDGKGANVAFGRGLLSLANDTYGNTFVCDVFNNAIRKIDPDGNTTTFAMQPLLNANGGNPVTAVAIAIDKNNNVFVANKTRIFQISPDGNTVTLLAGNTQNKNQDGIGATASFSGIVGLAFDRNGILFASTSDNNNGNTIRRIMAGGITSTFYTVPSAAFFTNMVVDSKGNVFVASSLPVIYKITPAGQFSVFAGGIVGYADGTGSRAQFQNPEGITIDPSDNLYIADSDNHRIRMITPGGKVTTIAGTGHPGPKDNTYLSNATKVKVQVKIVSALEFTDTYTDKTVPAAAACPASLPDYAKDATALSTCANKIDITQLPAAGTSLTIGQPVTVTLTAKDNLGQQTDVQFNVTAIPLPVPTVNITLQTQSLCDGSPLNFKAEVQNAGNAPSYTWKVNGTTKSTGSSSFTYNTPLNGEQVTCTVINNDYCSPVSSVPGTFDINTAPSINTSVSIAASTADAICPGVGITFTATPSNVQTASVSPAYQWKVNGNNRGGNSPAFTSEVLVNGDVVTCELTNNVKCAVAPVSVSNPITVFVKTDAECAIKVPNTFTPNDDGINDKWDIPELNSFPACNLSIFNRYGKIVYQSVGYAKSWDGLYKGQKLSAGTYYYMIDLKTGRPPLSGSVTILR